jgi:hypothetical protein
MKSVPAKPKSERSIANIVEEIPPFDAPGQLEHIARRVTEHRSLHEMVYAIARLCEPEEARELAIGVWPGLALLMDRLSAEGDELLSDVLYTQRQLAEKSGVR